MKGQDIQKILQHGCCKEMNDRATKFEGKKSYFFPHAYIFIHIPDAGIESEKTYKIIAMLRKDHRGLNFFINGLDSRCTHEIAMGDEWAFQGKNFLSFSLDGEKIHIRPQENRKPTIQVGNRKRGRR